MVDEKSTFRRIGLLIRKRRNAYSAFMDAVERCEKARKKGKNIASAKKELLMAYEALKRKHYDRAMEYVNKAMTLLTLPTIERVEMDIEDVFLIYYDGRLIHHMAKHLRPDMDDAIFGSMFTAVQEFIKDSLGRGGKGSLNVLGFGEKNVIIEQGRYVNLAVVFSGEVPESIC